MERSPLGRLPPERRNQIYHLVLHRAEPLKIHWCGDKAVSHWHRSTGRPLYLSQAALTMTCWSVREEGMQLFYAINSFVAKVQVEDPLEAVTIVRTLPSR